MCRRSFAASIFVFVSLCLSSSLWSQEELRIMTWNVQALGSIGSSDWNDALAVVNRIDADVVCIEEITTISEAIDFATFASQAGYGSTAISGAAGTMTGNLRNGVMSRFPIVSATSHNSISLSGDMAANDISRDILEVQVQVPNAAEVMAFFVVHLKSSSGGTNDFRRAVEVFRLRQALDAFRAAHPQAGWIVCGDFNEDLGDGPFGASFSSLPGGLPGSYNLGNDISLPINYDPFIAFTGLPAGAIMTATQEDSLVAVTRESSLRRLDYLIHNSVVTVIEDEVYNSVLDNGVDDGAPGMFLVKNGLPLAPGVSLAAADHFPVVADVEIPSLAVLNWPGTPDDFVQSTGINAAWTTGSGEDHKSAWPGDLFYLHYVSPLNTLAGSVPIVVGQLFPTGGPTPIGLTSGMHFDLNSAFALFDGYASPIGLQATIIPGFGNLHAWAMPAGYSGLSVMVQTVTYSNTAWNGFLVFSDGHVIDFL